MLTSTFYVPTLGPVQLRGEPSGWQYKTGGSIGGSVGIFPIPISIGVSVSTLVVQLTQGRALQARKNWTWRFFASGAQLSAGTVSAPKLTVDPSWSWEHWSSAPKGQIFRIHRPGRSTLSTSHKPFAKVQEFGAPSGLRGGFLLLSYSLGQLVGSICYNIMFCGADAVAIPKGKVQSSDLDPYRYVIAYFDEHRSLDVGKENVGIATGLLQLPQIFL